MRSWGFGERDFVFPVAQPVALELGHVEIAAAFAGTGGCVDLLQIDGNDAGVNLRGSQVFMAEQLLDVAHVGPSFEHFRRAGVAEPVGCRVVWQSGGFGESANDPPQHMGVQWAAVIVEEQLGDG